MRIGAQRLQRCPRQFAHTEIAELDFPPAILWAGQVRAVERPSHTNLIASYHQQRRPLEYQKRNRPSRPERGRTVVAMASKRKPPSVETLHPDDVLRLQEETLGRNLASAYIATQHGIGMDYVKKTHAHEPVGEFWISLARMVIEHMSKQPALPPLPQTIQ